MISQSFIFWEGGGLKCYFPFFSSGIRRLWTYLGMNMYKSCFFSLGVPTEGGWELRNNKRHNIKQPVELVCIISVDSKTVLFVDGDVLSRPPPSPKNEETIKKWGNHRSWVKKFVHRTGNSNFSFFSFWSMSLQKQTTLVLNFCCKSDSLWNFPNNWKAKTFGGSSFPT